MAKGKIGRQKRAPASMRYTTEKRWEKNKLRRMAKNQGITLEEAKKRRDAQMAGK